MAARLLRYLSAPPRPPNTYGPKWRATRAAFAATPFLGVPRYCRIGGVRRRGCDGPATQVNHAKYRWTTLWLRRPMRRDDPRRVWQVWPWWLHWVCDGHHREISLLHQHRGLSPLEATKRVALKYRAMRLYARLSLLRPN